MLKLLILIIAISFVSGQSTDCPQTFGSTDSEIYGIGLSSTPGLSQQYLAEYTGSVNSIQLLLDASSASVYLAVYTSLQNKTIYAKSSVVNTPQPGDVFFSFHNPWTQVEGTIYYIAPINTTSSTFIWNVKSGSNGNGTCVAYSPNSLDCSHQASLLVNYDRKDCCDPGCYNGGTCQSNATCSCVDPWGSASCLCYEGLVESDNGTCVEESCESGSCIDTCPSSISYSDYNSNTPLGSGWLLPGQFYLPTEYGYPTQLQMWVAGTDAAAGNPLYVDIIEYPSMYKLTSTTNITLGIHEYQTVYFDFLQPWFQDPAKQYIIYPRDPNINNPEYTVYSMCCDTYSDPCGYEFGYDIGKSCSFRLSFAMYYDKVCYNDGACSAGTCTCYNGYNGTSCEVAPLQHTSSTTSSTTSDISTTTSSTTSTTSDISTTTSSATSTTTSSTTAATPSTTLGTSSSSTTSTSLPASDISAPSKSQSSSNGAIIGGVIGGVFLLVVILIVVIFVVKKKTAKMESVKSQDPLEEGGIALDSVTVAPKFQIIKDVRIGKKLGEGNFGEVYHGMWNGTDVALKKINRGEDEALQQEAAMLTSLQHPNVVRLLGLYTDERGDTYLVMEYVAKGSLESLLKKEKQLTLQDKLSMIVSSCRGMAYMEAQKVIHRDISARNILVTKENDKYICKISDFGLSRNSQMYNSEGKVLPIRWAAPEVLNEQPCTIKGDVWAFGVVMWEVMEASLPYPEILKNKEVMEFVLKGGRMEKPNDCPDDLYKLMLQCWAENPEDRPNFSTILEKLLILAPKEEILVDDEKERPANYNYN